jgi:hypothetical protein
MIITHSEIDSIFYEKILHVCAICREEFANKEHKLEHLLSKHTFREIAKILDMKIVEFKT